MRRVGKEGRSIVKSFSYPKSKDEMIEEVEKIARKEGEYFSDVVVSLLERYVKEHSKSQNPQTEITLFQTGHEAAIPNVYEIIREPKKLKRFYKGINKKSDYKELDKGLMIWLTQHNKKNKEFL